MSFFLIQNIIAFLVPHFVYHYFIYKSSKTIGSSFFFLEKFSFVKLKAVGVFFLKRKVFICQL